MMMIYKKDSLTTTRHTFPGFPGIEMPPIETEHKRVFFGNVTYENDKLSRINMPEGYVSADGAFNAYYHDYQGNIRAVGRGGHEGTAIQINHYYPYGMTFAESSGQSANPYKYTSKEFITDADLNFHDFEARIQWPDIPLFSRPDPKEEDYTQLSPYTFCASRTPAVFSFTAMGIGIFTV